MCRVELNGAFDEVDELYVNTGLKDRSNSAVLGAWVERMLREER